MGAFWSKNKTSSTQVQLNDTKLSNKRKRKIDSDNESVELESPHHHRRKRQKPLENFTYQHSNIDKSATDVDQKTWQKSLLEELYTCPICMDLLHPYVIQCDNGHAVCGSCAAKLGSCPICHGDRPFWRNLWMEKVTERLRWPCRNAWRGCEEIVPAPQWHEHADSCTHTPPPVDEEEHDRKMEEFEAWLERKSSNRRLF